MLDSKTASRLLLAQHSEMEADEPSTAEFITNILGIIRRQIILVLVLGLIGSAFGVFFLLRSEPQFTATTTLLINTRKFEIFQQPPVSDAVPMQSAGAIESQVELLRSDEVALRVIKKLDLSENPRFVENPRKGFVTHLLHNVFPNYYTDAVSPIDREDIALKVFNNNLSVERVGVTYAIEIKFQSTDPELAADVANAVADAYIDVQRSSESDAARRASDWLEDRMPELRAKSEAAQKAVVIYKQDHNIVETSGGQLIEDQRLADVNVKLSVARDETLKVKTRLDEFDVSNSIGLPGALANVSNAGGASTSLDKLRTQYFDVTSKLAESSGKLGVNNPTIVGLRNQATQLRSEIAEEVHRLKQAGERDYAAAQLREANLKKEFDAAVVQAHGAKEAQVKLRELEASAHAYQDLYATYVSRYNASLQQAVSPIGEASIITPATSLIERDYKKTVKAVVLFPLAGVLLGLGIALLREMLAERVFLTSKSVQSRLRIACIGILPKLQAGKRMKWRLRESPDSADSKSLVKGDREIGWTVVDRPFSQFSEGVRSIKFAIDMENRSRSSRVIGITSALSNEGKSTVALAIAQMIASNGSSVVLVDCDLRNPSLTRSIAPNATTGIVEFALGKASIEDLVWTDRSTHLAFVPAIPHVAPPDPPSLLSSAEMKQAFDKLRQEFQYVIVDFSPLVPVIDVCATVEFVDGFVFVIEWGRTTVDLIKRALRAVPPVSDLIVGAVLNKAHMKQLTTYDPHTTSYYFYNSSRQ